MFTTLWHMVWP